MADPRKFYIATSKDDETKNQVFRFLGDEFSRASCAEEAEFIILDCDDPPRPKDWVNRNANFVVPDPCYPPLVLVALEKKDRRDFLEELPRNYGLDVTVLHVCDTQEELVRTLKRLQAALPFYNSKNAPAPDPAKIREMAISILRAG